MATSSSRYSLPQNEPIYSYEPGSKEKAEVKQAYAEFKEGPKPIYMRLGSTLVGPSERNSEASYCPHDHAKKSCEYPLATENDVQQAIDSALKAQTSWSKLSWQDRAAVFLKAADLMCGKYRARVNAATMFGQSKTVFQSEIDAVCELADFYRFNSHFAGEVSDTQPLSPSGMWNSSVPRGLEGFVYAIGPFNFTSIAINLAAAPALMGCSVLWKPASTSLLGAEVCLEILEEAGLPPGVINLVTGDAKLISSVALASPDLAGIHFTGSTGTFQHLWKEVGSRISDYKTYPRLVGETGGKDFIFAHPKCDVSALKTAMVRGAFEYQGQKCSAASRAYVPKSIWPKLKPLLKAQIDSLEMGSPEDFKNFMAAVIDRKAFGRIAGYIDHAKNADDAEIVSGGEYDDKLGYFIKPTLIETSNPKFKSMVEEIFGPVLTVYVYDDAKLEETLEVCDQSSPYALTGAIFAKDRLDIVHMTEKLRYAAGNFYINDKPTGAVVGQQPFGGARASGTNDKAGSIWNLLRWTSMRTVKETFAPPHDHPYPHMQES